MTARHAVARPLSWATAALLSLATALGLWFGVSAPNVSPVADPTAVVQVAPGSTTTTDQPTNDGGQQDGPGGAGQQDGPRGGDAGGRGGGGGGGR
ncbi:hypothetical protein SAMN05660199_01730 [Klenkia soli]|uniref:Uncharacterized protein n=1 Tax=Klenkia soli TaxID=1052260 RepID=A0A1H0IP36_9ACTN|nr:hypothetical protein [Klenkia soli]SDO33229.1 hypothetical protein SAMN05660199_01730 [Klenkia soli]